MKKILIIDTFNLLHRAYHALPSSFRDKAGEPVNAVYGVSSMLITLPGELWPLAPAARDLVEQVIENGIRGLLADPGKG